MRLGLVLDTGLSETLLRAMVRSLDAPQMEAVRSALAEKAAQLFPPATQLPRDTDETDATDSAFLI